jgi:hypothetical protein
MGGKLVSSFQGRINLDLVYSIIHRVVENILTYHKGELPE